MATPKGGFDSDFVDPPPKSLECPICLLTLREPHVISCCGNHFCRPCIDRIQKDRKPCPLCNEPNFSVFLHKGVMREINALPVRCAQKDQGCPWVGELGQLQWHLNPGTGPTVSGCGFVEVDCVYQCGGRFQRRLIQEHENGKCPKRPIELQLSGLVRKLEALLDENQALKQEVAQMSEARKLEVAQIKAQKLEFEAFKKSQEQQQREMREQCVLLVSQKLEFETFKKSQEQQQRELRERYGLLESCANPVPPFYYTFFNFNYAKRENLRLLSTPFYSHRGGYKLILDLHPNGSRAAKGSHVSLYVNIMRGEYDDKLHWPFRGVITVQVRNYQSQSVSWTPETTIVFDDSTALVHRSKPVNVLGNPGWGYPRFIPHGDLKQYIHSDHLISLRVTKVVLQ